MLRLVLLLVLGSTAAAERITVEEAERLALGTNPRFRAAQARAQATHDYARSARGRLGFTVRVTDEYQHFNCPFVIDFATFQGGCPGSAGAMAITAREQDTNT